MTRLALGPAAGYLFGLGSPPAGKQGKDLFRIANNVVDELKTRVRAGTSSVFNDLHALAAESGCKVTQDATFAVAQRFLLALPSQLPSPELSLDEDGEVALDWRGAGAQLLHVSIRRDGRLTYACWLAQNDREHGTKAFIDAIPKTLVDCIQRVAAQ